VSKSAFSIFAAYGGRQHALAEKKKRHRGQVDAFAGDAPPAEIENDERYTTRETIMWCKERAGVGAFDLDVAACAESHWSERYYTKADDGLAQPWDGGRVWCNPPYSDIAPWVEKAWAEWADRSYRFRERVIAMLLPAIKTEQPWWHAHVEPHRDRAGKILHTHFVPGRTAFARPGSGGVGQSGAPFGCVLLVWRRT
jgi:phage N-6-adenine-methyltransferase